MAKTDEYGDVPVQTLLQRVQESEKAREPYETNWERARDAYDGVVKLDKIAWWQSDPYYNVTAEFVNAMRGFLSDNQWGVDIIPLLVPEGASSKNIMEQVGKINKLVDFIYRDSRMQNKLAQVLQYVFMYGTGFIKSAFDPDNITDRGIGQIENSVVSPWYIFPDPDASSVQDADYLFEIHPVTLRWVMNRYPEKAAEVKEKEPESDFEDAERRGSNPKGKRNTDEGRRVDVFECWYRDNAILEDELDEDGNAIPKYPNGRYTIMTRGGIVLADGECMYSQWPYARFVDIVRPHEFFGDCTLHKALGIQETINKILREILDNAMWLVHGIWIVDTTSGLNPRKLAVVGPRDTVAKHPGTEARRETGPALPQTVFDLLNQQIDSFYRVVMFPDVLRGIVPSRQPVQTTLMQQESGEVSTRERQRRVEEGLADLGMLWLDIVSNHYSDKRNVSSKGALGGFDMFELSKDELEGWQFSISVVPGSTAPMDKNSLITRMQELQNSFGVQIPQQFLVSFADIPGLASAMQEQDKQMQEQAMAAEPEPSQSEEVYPEGEVGENPLLDEMMMDIPQEPEDDQFPDMGSLTPEELALIEQMGGMQALP